MQPNATGVELFRGKPVPVRYFATSPYLEVATKVRLAHEEGGFTEVSHEFVRVGDKDVIQICIEVKGQRFCGSAQIKSCTRSLQGIGPPPKPLKELCTRCYNVYGEARQPTQLIQWRTRRPARAA